MSRSPLDRRILVLALLLVLPAFAVAALSADGESVIEGAEAASVSFPEFWDTLGRITARAAR